MLIWVLDVGTSGLHGVLYDETAREVFRHYVEYSPNYGTGGRVEQAVADWRQAVLTASSACAAHCRQSGLSLDAVALTSQRSSLLLLDERCQPLRSAVMWQDTRCRAEMERLDPAVAQRVYEQTGAWPNPVFSGPKIAWCRREQPELWRRAAHLAVIPDYLLWVLTGKLVTDVTYAARSHLMSLTEQAWSPWLAALFGAPLEKLSPILPQGSIVGGTCAGFAQATGLPQGIPVVTAGGDQQCAAQGAGINAPGRVLMNVGTGANLLAWSDTPTLDAEHAYLTIPAAQPGGYLLETSSLSAASVYRWLNRLAYQGETGYAAINAEAAEAGAGAHGVLLLPYLQGRGAPDWNREATGTFQGVHLGTTRGDLARAVLEGVALELRACLDTLPHGAARELYLTGGLTACPIFPQIMADVTGMPVHVGAEENYTALGALIGATRALRGEATAVQAACASGFGATLMPDPKVCNLYAGKYQSMLELYRKLYPSRQEGAHG